MKVVLLCLLLLLPSVLTYAGNVSFCGVCSPLRMVQKKDTPELKLYCPGADSPWMTFSNCPNARARLENGMIQIYCNNQKVEFPLDTKPLTK